MAVTVFLVGDSVDKVFEKFAGRKDAIAISFNTLSVLVRNEEHKGQDVDFGGCYFSETTSEDEKHNLPLAKLVCVNKKVSIPALRVSLKYLKDYCSKNNIQNIITLGTEIDGKQREDILCTFKEMFFEIDMNLLVLDDHEKFELE